MNEPEDNCICRCGEKYKSRTKFESSPSHIGVVSEKPCPNCGKTTNLKRVSSEERSVCKTVPAASILRDEE